MLGVPSAARLCEDNRAKRRADAVNRLRTQAYVTAFASSPEHARRVNRAMTGTRTAADFVNMYASSPEIAARVNAR